jgi:hypothetical protein
VAHGFRGRIQKNGGLDVNDLAADQSQLRKGARPIANTLALKASDKYQTDSTPASVNRPRANCRDSQLCDRRWPLSTMSFITTVVRHRSDRGHIIG